jgi:hypothetical protein
MRWMLWLRMRHGTRLAVQQQGFERDSNADYKILKVLRRHCIFFAALSKHIEKESF